jgi:hypothetical protein
MWGGKEIVTKRKTHKKSRNWRVIDLHIHTPASSDYQEPEVSLLDILRRSNERGLEIIAITDHNTVSGYRSMQEEISQLEMLEKLERITTGERDRLKEYRSLLNKILVLPGFEFTATFGFHILGIFPPEMPVREIEYLLLQLNIPSDQLDLGSSTVGATADVLTAYRIIDEAGGLVIAAHANSTNGVAMRGFRFGGQTKIAYTQDRHLHALEVTDLNQGGRRTTASFFSGTKPEYPRRMHCIQGSDAHRLFTDQKNRKNLGIGDRATEVHLEEISFMAIKALFLSNDFARTRPKWAASKDVFDFVQQAREEGPSIVQDFHESMAVRGGRLYAILADVCSFANTNGGTLFIGAGSDPKKLVEGINNPSTAMKQLEKELSTRINPPISPQIDVHTTQGKKIIRVLVPQGEDPPYAVDDNKIYVRDEAETGLAVRDEIVQLVRRGLHLAGERKEEISSLDASEDEESIGILPPRTGVEIVADVERGGNRYFSMKDLRNGNVVKNVTKSSARRLWHYAISQYTQLPKVHENVSISWEGEIGILKERKQGNRISYDLAQKTPEGIKIYFGVTEDGIHSEWRRLLGHND